MQVIRTTGGRKTAIARIGLKTGKGNIEINKKPLEDYFQTEILRTVVKQPLQVDHETPYDITVNVTGGGFNGQAEAIRLAIARALCKLDGGYRAELKKTGYAY